MDFRGLEEMYVLLAHLAGLKWGEYCVNPSYVHLEVVVIILLSVVMSDNL